MTMNTIKTAILGGSFDPVHLGHLFLLHQAVSLTDYRQFIIVPALLSNFKQDSKPVTSAEDRLKMIELSILDYKELYPEDDGRIIVSDTEFRRGGVSYTYDTVLEIKKELKIQDRLGLIIGDDHIRKLKQWYKFDELVNEVEFLICPRNEDVQVFDLIPDNVVYKKLECGTTALENATAIRNNLKENLSYLSGRVKKYVREKNLYC